MKRVRIAAAKLANGAVCTFIFFYMPVIRDIFPELYIAILNQVLVGCMGICIFVAPNEIIEMGRKIAPKIKGLIDIVFGRKI